MEKFDIYLKKFKVAVGILVAALVVCIFLLVRTIPEIQKIIECEKSTKTAMSSLSDAERKLEGLKASFEKKQEETTLAKEFFKPVSTGLDTESAIADEFAEILQIMRENKIKARSIKYDYDPQDDNFVKHVSDKYHVCRVSTEMIATYTEFENFIRDLFKHEHFLEISKIEITPYQKNKRILLISAQIKLYAQK